MTELSTDPERFVRTELIQTTQYCAVFKSTDKDRLEDATYIEVITPTFPGKSWTTSNQSIKELQVINHPAYLKFINVHIPKTLFSQDPHFTFEPTTTVLFADDTELSSTVKSKILFGIAYGMKLAEELKLPHDQLTSNSVLLDLKLEPKLFIFPFSNYFYTQKQSQIPSDQFAFALILYRLLTGKEANLTRQAIRKGERPPLPQTNFDSLLEKCWSSQPPSWPEILDTIPLFEGASSDDVNSYRKLLNAEIVTQTIGSLFLPSTVEQLEQSAESGNLDSMVKFADVLEHGQLMPQDLQRAYTFYQLAAESQHPVAIYHTGRCLRDGIGIDKDIDAAISLLQKSAKMSNINALIALAEIQQSRNQSEDAAKNFKIAADMNDAFGEFKFGRCARFGQGVAQDPTIAIQFFKRSADQGNSWGQNNYGAMLFQGLGVKENVTEAVKYFQMSADQGNSWGHFNFASCCERGIGTTKDLNVAIRHYRKAADLGEVEAKFALGMIYEDSAQKNLDNAVKYFKDAMEMGHIEAKGEYGRLLVEGLGTDADVVTGMKILEEAADQGDSISMMLIAKYHLDGKIVEKNIAKAKVFAERALSVVGEDGKPDKQAELLMRKISRETA